MKVHGSPAPGSGLALPATMVLAAVVLTAAGQGSGLPHNDAGAYHRMVDLWIRQGHPVFIGWNEMTLLGHLAWARVACFSGLSHVAARQWLTGLQALLTVLVLFASIRRLRPGLSPAATGVLAAAWLANPITLLSATSFMTGIPATLWLAVTLLAFLHWSENGGPASLTLATLGALAAFSIRQTSIVAVGAIAVASLLPAMPRRKRWSGLLAATAAGALSGALWLYRATIPLATIRPMRAVLVSGPPLHAAAAFGRHAVEAAVLCALLLVPLIVLSSRGSVRGTIRGALLGLPLLAVPFLTGTPAPFWGNILTPTGLAPDLLPPHGALPPAVPSGVLWLLTVIGAFAAGTVLGSIQWRPVLSRPGPLALLLTIAGTLAATAMIAAPFDRYLVPALALFGPLAAAGMPEPPGNTRTGAALVLLAAFLAWGAAGSRFVHERERALWNIAATEVERGTPAIAVDGGFEWNLWHQPVPFHPEEARSSRPVLVWYERYPFTRLHPTVRLWIGPPPPGWTITRRCPIPGGLTVSVLRRIGGGRTPVGLHTKRRPFAPQVPPHDRFGPV